MPYEEVTRWFDSNRAFFEAIDEAADSFLKVVTAKDRAAMEAATNRLLLAVIQGQSLPPMPDAEAQRHFAAGLARYRDAAETLSATEDEGETQRAIRAIDAAGAEFARMTDALDREESD